MVQRYFFIAVSILLATTPVAVLAAGNSEIDGPIAAQIIRVIDGDTLMVAARPWPQQIMEAYVRLRGIDAPEIHAKCPAARIAAEQAKMALQTMAAEGASIQLTHISGDKYFGRILANVQLENGHDAAHDLLLAGHAQPYDGGHKQTPCE